MLFIDFGFFFNNRAVSQNCCFRKGLKGNGKT
jgi:hypothetical protein